MAAMVLTWAAENLNPSWFKKSFLRKSQDLHLDAVPTTYAKRSLRKKRGFHTSSQVRNSSTLLDTHSEVR